MLFEPVLVELHELPGAALQGREAVLAADDFEALLAQAGDHRVLFGRGDLRRPLLLESKRMQNRVASLGARVAAEAVAAEPSFETDSLGASWMIHARRTAGDALLVTISGSDRTQEAEITTHPLHAVDGEGAAQLPLMTTSMATCHASAYLRAGQAMLVGSQAKNGKVLCLRVLRPTPVAWGAVGGIVSFPVAPLVAGSLLPEPIHVPYETAPLFPQDRDESMATVCDEGRLMELLTSSISPDSWDGSPHTMNYLDGNLWVRADAATQQAVQTQLLRLQKLDARQFSLDVRFGEVDAGVAAGISKTAAAELADALPNRCVSVVSASRGARISATRHVPFIADYNVNIATGSAGVSPEIHSFVQGFLMRADVAPVGDKAARLDVHLTMLDEIDQPSSFDLKHPRIGLVHRIDVRENKVRGATVVGVGDWTVLHLAPLEGGVGHVAVVARLRVAR